MELDEVVQFAEAAVASEVQGEFRIRSALQILIAMLLTGLVLVAGYGAVLAAQLDPAHAKGTSSTFTPVEPLPMPTDAPVDLLPVTFDPPSSPDRPTGSCSVEVGGEASDMPELSVAVFDQRSGALLASKALDNSQLPQVLAFNLPVGLHPIYLTRGVSRARISYVDRAILEVIAGEGTTAAATRLSNTTFDLTVLLQDTDVIPAKIPVWIRRVDDPKWRHSESSGFAAVESLMLSDDRGRVTFAGLARGSYSLNMQGFEPTDAEPGRLVFDIEAVEQPLTIPGNVR